MRRSPKKLWIAVACSAALALSAADLLLAAGVEADEERKLIEVLESDAGLFEKAKACQRLAVVGTANAVPALTNLLDNEELSHYARFGLEPIAHPSVDEALRAALARIEGALRIGVINSIGVRRDTKAEAKLMDYLSSPDAELAAAAAAAIGRIGTTAGAAALRATLTKRAKELGRRLGEATIVCAETLAAAGKRDAAVETFLSVRNSALPTHVRAAALRGEILARGDDGLSLLLESIRGADPLLQRIALGVARELPGRRATEALVEALDELSQETKVQICRVFADRRDRAALPAVLAIAGAEEESMIVRIAAIQALAQLGDATVVPRLARAAAADDREVSASAMETLAVMGDEEVDGATLALLDVALRRGRGERGVSFLRTMVEVVGRRTLTASVRLVREAAEHEDESVRLAAIRSLGTTIGLDDFGALVERLESARNEAETAAVREALGMASRRMPSPAACAQALANAMDGAPANTRRALLGVFSAIGAAEALDVVAASTRASDAAERHAALAALGEWPNESAVFKLIETIPTLEGAADRTRAYQAFRGIVRRLGFDRNLRIGACVDAMKLAASDAERKLTIAAFEGIPAPRTLNLLAPHLESETLRGAAASAMVTICERLIRTRQRGAVGPAMKKVLEVTKDDDLVRRAQSLAQQASGN